MSGKPLFLGAKGVFGDNEVFMIRYMNRHIRHIRSPEAPPRRPDHPTFGEQGATSIGRHLATLKQRWSSLRSKTGPLLQRLVRKTAG